MAYQTRYDCLAPSIIKYMGSDHVCTDWRCQMFSYFDGDRVIGRGTLRHLPLFASFWSMGLPPGFRDVAGEHCSIDTVWRWLPSLPPVTYLVFRFDKIK